jgi:hypothetical protein
MDEPSRSRDPFLGQAHRGQDLQLAGLQGIFGYELAHQRLALVEGQ